MEQDDAFYAAAERADLRREWLAYMNDYRDQQPPEENEDES